MSVKQQPATQKTFNVFILLSEQDNDFFNTAALRVLLEHEQNITGNITNLDKTIEFFGRFKEKNIKIYATSKCSFAHIKLREKKYDVCFFNINKNCFTIDIYDKYKDKFPVTGTIESTSCSDILFKKSHNKFSTKYLINKDRDSLEKIMFLIKILSQNIRMRFIYSNSEHEESILKIRNILNERLPILSASEKTENMPAGNIYLELNQNKFILQTLKEKKYNLFDKKWFNFHAKNKFIKIENIEENIIKTITGDNKKIYSFAKTKKPNSRNINIESKFEKIDILRDMLEHRGNPKSGSGEISYLLAIGQILNSLDKNKIYKRVFISYVNTESNQETVWNIAKKLIANHIDTRIDQYYPALNMPWIEWMDEQFEKADYIIVYAHLYNTEKELRTENRGRGSKHEKNLVSTKISNNYQNKCNILLLLDENDDPRDERNLPLAWQGYQHYKYPSDLNKVMEIIKYEDESEDQLNS